MLIRLGLAVLAVTALNAAADNFDADFYHARYGLNDPYGKRVDNYGNGFEALYGVRNMREVLKGVLYRGGANNAYNKHGKRDNSNPLPDEGLANLCAEGFKNAVYLYATRYSTAKPQLDCRSIRGSNHFDYLQINPKTKPYEILKLVYAAIFNSQRGPIYVHCWNGWHASGLIAALALRQFCGVSGNAAVSYWEKNVDKQDWPSMNPVKDMIRKFTPYPDLQISMSIQRQICPSL
jgi:hypothetical protein